MTKTAKIFTFERAPFRAGDVARCTVARLAHVSLGGYYIVEAIGKSGPNKDQLIFVIDNKKQLSIYSAAGFVRVERRVFDKLCKKFMKGDDNG